MSLSKIQNIALDKKQFTSIQKYIDFTKHYLDYTLNNLQAVIVSQNENHYQFYQYDQDGFFQITRPINSNLMYKASIFDTVEKEFQYVLKNINDTKKNDRTKINNSVYTIQQSIGAALDSLPAGQSNKARKINGDLFERLILLILQEIGLQCRSGVVKIPITINQKKAFDMKYQHDLIIEHNGTTKVIGSAKTSSKDRIDKIFIDKFLHNQLTKVNTPHIAVFLNDVQRAGKPPKKYKISSTFLPGHFKGYTVKLNPLDGVYYCDIRPNMLTEDILKDHIKTLDHLICDDIWNLIK